MLRTLGHVTVSVGGANPNIRESWTKKGLGDHPSPLRYLVEPGGIEPPSASPPQAVLHAYSVNLDLTSGVVYRQTVLWRFT